MNQTGTVAAKASVGTAAKTKKIKSSKKKALMLSRRTATKIGVAVGMVLVIFGGIFYFERSYAERIYPRLMVAGVNIGGMNRDEAKTVLSQKIESLNTQGPTIVYNDQTVTPRLDEMGITFNLDEILNQAYDYGHNGSLTQKIKDDYEIAVSGVELDLQMKVDEAKFEAYLGSLANTVEKSPRNAALEIHSGQIALIPAENGRGLDKTKLKNDLQGLINAGTVSGRIVMQTSDIEPQIKESGTADARGQAEKYLAAAPIVVTFETSNWVADKSEIGSWINFAEDGDHLNTSVSPNSFIGYIRDQITIPAKDREIQDGTGAVLNDGQDGRSVDTDTLTAQIRDALGRGTGATFAVVTSVVPRGQKTIYPHAQPGRYSGRYIDVNLSEQMLYAFEGPTLVNQFAISSGKSGYATPTGEFNVYGKDASALMDGPGYYLPNVPYISWFSGDYSIHGTYWHSNFGHPMSHGCVNASTPDAEWLFGWDEVGTPVYIHY